MSSEALKSMVHALISGDYEQAKTELHQVLVTKTQEIADVKNDDDEITFE